MTNWNFSKARNFPLNRDGETITFEGTEGELVGISENADGEPELVKADADDASPQPAMGVLMEEVQDPSDISVSGFQSDYVEERQLQRQMREEDYTLVGDEGTYVFNGVMLEDVDADTDFVPNEAVYLGVGGGFTQTKPDATDGNIIQTVGVAVDANTILLDVDFDYTTA